MPEGPSIIILKEAVQPFKGKKILEVTGNTRVDKSIFVHQKVIDFKSWGKHFLICLPKFTIRIHFMLFGSYSINEKIATKKVRLHFKFSNGDLYLYASAIKIIEEDINAIY